MLKKLNSKTADKQPMAISGMAARGILDSKTEEENIE